MMQLFSGIEQQLGQYCNHWEKGNTGGEPIFLQLPIREHFQNQGTGSRSKVEHGLLTELKKQESEFGAD